MSTLVQAGSVVTGLSVGSQATSLTGVTQHNALILGVSWMTANPPAVGPQLDSTAVAAGWLVSVNPDGVTSSNTSWCTGSAIFYLLDAPAGTNTVTIIFEDSTHVKSQIVEASGVSTTRAFDQSGVTVIPPSVHTATVVTGVPTQSTGIAFALCSAAGLSGNGNNTQTDPPTGWTSISANQDTNGNPSYSFDYALITSAIAQSATWTWGSGGEASAVIATFGSVPVSPPTLTSPTATSIMFDRVTLGATTNSSTGTQYAVVYIGSDPNAAQIEAGQNGTFVATPNANVAVTVSGANGLVVPLLAPSTAYKYALVHQNVNGSSNVVTGTFTTRPTPPLISSTNTVAPLDGSTLVITGLRFGATAGSTGTVTLGGTLLSVSSWSDTSISAIIVLGLNKYGTELDLIVSGDANGASNPYAITNVLPISGWSYVDFGTPNATAGFRVTSTTTDIIAGDQAAYDNKGGLVTMRSDASFSADQTVLSFNYKVWSSGVGYGSAATETFGSGSGAAAKIFGRNTTGISTVFGKAFSGVSRFF